MASKGTIWLGEKALAKLRDLPRVTLTNLWKRPEECDIFPITKLPRRYGRGHRGWYDKQSRKQRPDAIGFEHLRTPVAYRTPKEKSYNYGWFAKRQYPPLSLKNLQFMIDTGRIDPSKPIDLAALANTMLFPINPDFNHFGFNLTEEGADCFKAKVNIEVQWANEASIAAVERNGGIITTAYFDFNCVRALVDPKKWFLSGKPIPRRLHPTQDAVEFYMSAENRGYLADPARVAEHRFELAQKYGYQVAEVDPSDALLTATKDPRQVFYGLEPGWIVNLKDKVIFKPLDEDLKRYYSQEKF